MATFKQRRLKSKIDDSFTVTHIQRGYFGPNLTPVYRNDLVIISEKYKK